MATPGNYSLLSSRGTLLLSPSEAQRINEIISSFNFRLDPCLEIVNPSSKPKTKVSSHGTSSHHFSDDYTPRLNRKRSSDSYVRTYSNTQSSFDFYEKRSSRVRKQPVTFLDEFYDENGNTNVLDDDYVVPRAEKRVKSSHTKKEVKPPPVILYKAVPASTKHLPKLPKDTWEYACYRILQVIKYMDTDKWFWFPVDPIVDGVPNYLSIIKHPMDFHTVTERLHTKYYSTPFGWQLDMRQIFYNAFLFYPPDNVIWQAAHALAAAYENKLKTCKYLNPDEYLQSLSMDQSVVKQELESIYAPRSKKYYDKNVVEPIQTGSRRAGAKKTFTAEVYSDEYDDSYHSSSVEFSDDDFESHVPARGRPRIHKKTPFSPQRDVIKRSRVISRLPKLSGDSSNPEYGKVLHPPPLQRLINDKPLTAAQQKTLEINLARLVPEQRKAALELVQDDLGILAENHKDDKDFVFDTDLLSVDKQKQFFIYVNQMAKRNMDHMIKASEKMRETRIEPSLPAPSEMFDVSSSSSSSLSDVASNLLSSDEFFSSSDSENDMIPEKTKPSDHVQDVPEKLPEYKPVDEFDSQTPHISEGIMGDHADFLGKMETPVDTESNVNVGKKSAWMEWKGQVIHHGMVAQQTGVPPRNVDEQIAESFDARI
ncbi:bromodomain containing protein [Theileria equi strain WA]|uniref:Bromodomain containing protein n=1 Tax=Theileria equi strain WA TaxID=1537102 RepID=L0AY01_THEEQ|nr:bromodomain containing protein [Theileria equi strain WA]AFZ80425.1 bromodomain containing protein [Theileria equi strain WA]|eukprot:XP_004830091.1 bromodomain containing protein [Theileria equi strain WA]